MFEALFALAETLRTLLVLRLTFLGLFLGSILGSLYKKIAYGSGSAGDDVLTTLILVGGAVGFVLDVRRGLRD